MDSTEIAIFNDVKTFHHGKEISKVAVSPKGTYVVTYSIEDESIVGWKVGPKDTLSYCEKEENNQKDISIVFDREIGKVPNSDDIKVSDNMLVAFLEGSDILGGNLDVIYRSFTLLEIHQMTKKNTELSIDYYISGFMNFTRD